MPHGNNLLSRDLRETRMNSQAIPYLVRPQGVNGLLEGSLHHSDEETHGMLYDVSDM